MYVCRVARTWRNGFGVGGDWVWAAPIAALILVAVGQATNSDGDIRSGMFPWFMAAAAVGLALLCLRLVAVHAQSASRSALIGGWWATLAFLGIAGFFVAIGVGAVLGIDEDDAGALALLPVIAMAFGLLSMTPAVALLALGAGRSGVLPRWAVGALWTIMPLLPVLLIYGGLVDGPAEMVGATVVLVVFAASWVVVGWSIRRIE